MLSQAEKYKAREAVRFATLQKAKEDKEMGQCTFKLVIDKRSDKLAKKYKARCLARESVRFAVLRKAKEDKAMGHCTSSKLLISEVTN